MICFQTEHEIRNVFHDMLLNRVYFFDKEVRQKIAQSLSVCPVLVPLGWSCTALFWLNVQHFRVVNGSCKENVTRFVLPSLALILLVDSRQTAWCRERLFKASSKLLQSSFGKIHVHSILGLIYFHYIDKKGRRMAIDYVCSCRILLSFPVLHLGF